MAIKSQQTKFEVSTAALTADVITAITKANPGVVSSTAHGIANGKIVVVAAVAGMIEVNDRAFVVANTAANTLELKGIDTTNYTTYVSGGTVTEQTMTEVGSVSGISGFDGEASEIDTTHLRSTAKEFLLGLQDFGQVTLALFLVSDTGQARLRALKGGGTIGTFAITLSDGTIAAFRGLVKSFSFDNITPDGAVSGSVTIKVTGEPAWFA
jgi:hypothetical protein